MTEIVVYKVFICHTNGEQEVFESESLEKSLDFCREKVCSTCETQMCSSCQIKLLKISNGKRGETRIERIFIPRR